MNTDVLSYCIDLATYLSFTKVAEKNHITQQALSQQIINLEQSLGVRLFERNNRSVKLTPAGDAFVSEAAAGLFRIETAMKRAQVFAQGQQGSISLGYNGPSSHYFLIAAIEEFHKLYPDIDVDVRHSTYTNIVSDFKNGAFDMIIVADFEQLDDSKYVIKKRNRGVVKIAVSKKHPFAQKKVLYQEELLEEQLISLDFSDNVAAQLKNMDRIRSYCGGLPKRIKFVRDTETVSLFVESGLGYTFLTSNLKKTYKNESLEYINIFGVKNVLPSLILWNRCSKNPALPLFVELIDKISLE